LLISRNLEGYAILLAIRAVIANLSIVKPFDTATLIDSLCLK
jgi:hypothetical protein